MKKPTYITPLLKVYFLRFALAVSFVWSFVRPEWIKHDYYNLLNGIRAQYSTEISQLRQEVHQLREENKHLIVWVNDCQSTKEQNTHLIEQLDRYEIAFISLVTNKDSAEYKHIMEMLK